MNKIYAVIYELKDNSFDYTGLTNELQKKAWMHFFQSAWLINTDETPEQACARLKNHIAKDDFILVIEVTKNYFGWLPQEAWDWFKDNSP